MGNYYEVNISTRNGPVVVIMDYDQKEKVDKLDRLVLYKDPNGRPLARSGKDSGQVLLHRYLFDVPKGHKLEWKNKNTLDLRRSNLRLVAKDGTITELSPEEQPTDNGSVENKRSSVKGVYFHKASQRWTASAYWKGKRYSLGYFQDEQEAIDEVTVFREEGPASLSLRKNHSKGDN